HSSMGSPKIVQRKSGRFSALASRRPSLTSVTQGICCHLFSAAVGLMAVASLPSSAGVWTATCDRTPEPTVRTPTASNRPATAWSLVTNMAFSCSLRLNGDSTMSDGILPQNVGGLQLDQLVYRLAVVEQVHRPAG